MALVGKLFCLLLCSAFLLATCAATAQTKPANPALRRELLKRLKQDQDIRNQFIKQGNKPDAKLQKRWQEIDDANAARMREILKQNGWPGIKLVGKEGTEAAFLLIQHADHALQKEALPLVKTAFEAGELDGQDYALLLDRVLMRDGKPQVYGTQPKPFDQWKENEATLHPIEDEPNVDKRRAEVGLPPLAEYKKKLVEVYFPKGKPK